MCSHSNPPRPTLADTQQRFENLVNRIDGIVWEADPTTGRFTFVSAQAERILGYAMADWYTEGFWAAHLHPDDREAAMAYGSLQPKGVNNYALEYRMLGADGQVVWLKDCVSVGASAHQPETRCGIMLDITERRALADGGLMTTYTDLTELERAQQAMRLSASVFESSAEGILITDATTRILKVNRAFSVITGYEANDVLGQPPALLRSVQQDAAFYQSIWHAIGEHGHWSGELCSRRKSGERFVKRLAINRVLDAGGAVTHYIATFSDISHAKATQNKIKRLSYFDALTGLPNRALLQDRLEHALLNAKCKQRQVALLTLDIERLRHINDTLGYHIGDQVIVAVAQRLAAYVRPGDTISRHCSDEFAVILEDLDDAQAAAHIAGNILAVLDTALRIEEHEISIRVRIGISLFPDDGQSALMLLKNAAAALHHAKDSGSFQFFREEMSAASMEQMLIENSLRLALRRQEFRVFYQAQLDFASGRIVGMEALVRWEHPELGLVPPGRFIQVTEESGQIIEIGLWVLRIACQDTRGWHDLGHDQLRVAVNVSARQFNEGDFAAQVKQVLQETGLAPEWLELELTESLIMQRPERVINIMLELRTLGVKFSIDDFGTGYSSLSQLKRFPIDKLKIDQSFTRDIGLDDDGAAITRAVIALGTSLRLQVVAEGVETGEQLRFLIDNGCHSMQGYLFSRPIPATDFACLLADHTAPQRCIETMRNRPAVLVKSS